MERTNFVTKLISVLLFIAMAIYLGIYFFRSYYDTIQTSTVVSYSVEDAYTYTGIIARSENVIELNENIVSLTVSEGEKVSAGQAVAVTYESEEALYRESQIRELELEIEQLSSYLDQSGTNTIDDSIKSGVLALNYEIGRGDLTNLDETLISLKALCLAKNTESAQTHLSSLRESLSTLQSSGLSRNGTVSVSTSGIFSSNVDGYEYLTPESLSEMSTSELSSLISGSTENVDGGQGGDSIKLISGISWYYAAVLPSSEAAKLESYLEDGVPLYVTFTGLSANALKTTVLSISEDEGGSCAVILSCSSALSDTLASRRMEAEIVFDSYTGLRIPKSAVRLDNEDGEPYVYTLTGERAEIKKIHIIYEGNNYYLVSANGTDGTSMLTGSFLREGNEIIVSGKGLYDGKVVIK